MNLEPCCRSAPLFQNLLMTFLIHVPLHSLPKDICYYGLMLSGCGECDSSLSKAALGLFAAVHKAIMYLSPTAKCDTFHRSSFCVPFSVQQSKNMSYFPMSGRRIYGDLKSEIFGKIASHYYRNNWLGVFIHEYPGCTFKTG